MSHEPKSILFYNLYPRTNWKKVTRQILVSVPHDEIVVHITLPYISVLRLFTVKRWICSNYPKVSKVLWSFNRRRLGETRGLDAFRSSFDFSGCDILSYAHSKGSSRRRKNTPEIWDWMELMRYFVVERLDLAQEAFEQGYLLYGVNLSERMHPKPEDKILYPFTKFIYEGNFVTVNLAKLKDEFLSAPIVRDYYGVERFWGTLCGIEKAYSVHQSRTDHYNELYPRTNYVG